MKRASRSIFPLNVIRRRSTDSNSTRVITAHSLRQKRRSHFGV
jgi:hypothetical protein